MGRARHKFFISVLLVINSLIATNAVQTKTKIRSDLLKVLDTNANHRVESTELLDLSLAVLGYTDFTANPEYDVNNDLIVNDEDKRILSLFLVSYKERYQVVIRAINSIDTDFNQIISQEEISAYKEQLSNNENTNDIRVLSKYDLNYDKLFDHKDIKLIDHIIDHSNT